MAETEREKLAGLLVGADNARARGYDGEEFMNGWQFEADWLLKHGVRLTPAADEQEEIGG